MSMAWTGAANSVPTPQERNHEPNHPVAGAVRCTGCLREHATGVGDRARCAGRDRGDADRQPAGADAGGRGRSEEHTSELQSLMRISYAVFCLKKNNNNTKYTHTE